MEKAKRTVQQLANQLQLTAKTNCLTDAAEQIALDPAVSEDANYQHAILCQVGMPRKRTDGLTFERRNGNAALLLTAGRLWDGRDWVQQLLPYGPKARIILINVTSYAVRHRTPCVDVGRSAREFMKRVGLDDQGSEYRSLNRQIRALAACRMQLAGRTGNRITNVEAQPIKRFDAWVTPNLDQQTLWPGIIELSHEYYTSCIASAVPLDERAVAALRGSALSLDIYTWLAHRLWRVRESNGVLLDWPCLRTQFGTEYVHLADFKKKFRIALQQVRVVYPAAHLQELPEGLLLRTSPPPIPRTALVAGR